MELKCKVQQKKQKIVQRRTISRGSGKQQACKLFRDDKEPATCGIYTEWADAEAQKQSLESRAADIEETSTSLKDGARPEIHVYNMLMTDSKDGAVL